MFVALAKWRGAVVGSYIHAAANQQPLNNTNSPIIPNPMVKVSVGGRSGERAFPCACRPPSCPSIDVGTREEG
jgi:hypothetical protein